MNSQSLFWMVILSILFGVAGFEMGYRFADKSNPLTTTKSRWSVTLQNNQEYRVKSIRVIEGHVFDVYLENEKRYLVRLHDILGTAPEAKDRIKQLLSKHQQDGAPAHIIVRGWDEAKGQWLVDLRYDQSNITASEYLWVHNLAYSR